MSDKNPTATEWFGQSVIAEVTDRMLLLKPSQWEAERGAFAQVTSTTNGFQWSAALPMDRATTVALRDALTALLDSTDMRFTLDNDDRIFEAVSFGEPWNGWLTPVVTRATFEAVTEPEMGDTTLTFDEDGVATFTDLANTEEPYVITIEPDADGNYDLAPLGWTFDSVWEEEA